MTRHPRIATLESFIIDTFTRISDGKETPLEKESIGGAGTYATIGARIFLPACRLTMIVDYTPDTLPKAMEDKLLSFGDMWHFRQRTDGHGTTRAVNSYDGEKRGFEYLSPPLLLTPRDLDSTPDWVHLVSMPDRTKLCLDQLDPGVAVAWEPEPPCCTPENLDVIERLTSRVDVMSPNHTEAMALFGVTSSDRNTLEWLVRQLVSFGPKLGVVIRAGALGCVYALSGEDNVYWCPAFWSDQGRVVDPTGAGNAFMGGLVAALDDGKDIHEAVVWASVAASFVVEQDGLPSMTKILGREVWNGDYPWERVDALKKKREMAEN